MRQSAQKCVWRDDKKTMNIAILQRICEDGSGQIISNVNFQRDARKKRVTLSAVASKASYAKSMHQDMHRARSKLACISIHSSGV